MFQMEGSGEQVPSCDVSDNRARSMREDSPLGLLHAGRSVDNLCKWKTMQKLFQFRKIGWDGLQKSMLKSPMNSYKIKKIERIKLMYNCKRKVSKMATEEDGGL